MSDVHSIADLKTDPKNRRKHNPRNVGMIVQALHEVGAARSIVIDEQGNVLAGNGTIDAASRSSACPLTRARASLTTVAVLIWRFATCLLVPLIALASSISCLSCGAVPSSTLPTVYIVVRTMSTPKTKHLCLIRRRVRGGFGGFVVDNLPIRDTVKQSAVTGPTRDGASNRQSRAAER